MSRILIVDDSRLARRGLRHVLEKQGYEVAEAEDGQTAINLLKDSGFDCILTDILMPGLSGMDVLESLSQRTPGCPVIVLTADIQESTHAECMEKGAWTVLSKPIRKADIVKAVGDAVDAAAGGESA